MDEGRLRENGRVVRTLAREWDDAGRVLRERFIADFRENTSDLGLGDEIPTVGPTPEDEVTAAHRVAQSQLLRALTTGFLELTVEVAGDLDQDLPDR